MLTDTEQAAIGYFMAMQEQQERERREAGLPEYFGVSRAEEQDRAESERKREAAWLDLMPDDWQPGDPLRSD